jgi:hypothetical protein
VVQTVTCEGQAVVDKLLPWRKMTHEDLRKLAVHWLTISKKCTVVLSEIVTYAAQIPDAIGWKQGCSTLVECKVSRSDFLRDKDKCHQRSDATPGIRRFYLTPPGLLQIDDLPEGWGLLEAREKYVKVMRDSSDFAMTDRAMRDEIAMLVSALRRVKQREFLVIVPETEQEVTI